MLSLGETLILFPQYTPMLMSLVTKQINNLISIGCFKCLNKDGSTTLRVPNDYVFGMMIMVSQTYPDLRQHQSCCMWYDLPFQSSTPNKTFLHRHEQVPFALRDDCSYVISIFLGFLDPDDNDQLYIMDCWVRLGYTIKNLTYEQRINLIKEIGFKVLLQVDRDERISTSTWSIYTDDKYIKYFWIPAENDKFSLLTSPEGKLFDAEGVELLHDSWKEISNRFTRNTTVTVLITKCKRNRHHLKLLKTPYLANILRVPSIFVK